MKSMEIYTGEKKDHPRKKGSRKETLCGSFGGKKKSNKKGRTHTGEELSEGIGKDGILS